MYHSTNLDEHIDEHFDEHFYYDSHDLHVDEHNLDDAYVPTEWRHLRRQRSVL